MSIVDPARDPTFSKSVASPPTIAIVVARAAGLGYRSRWTENLCRRGSFIRGADMAGSETTKANQGPLTGIRVIDLTSVIFGPYATQTLGDMGADVIKVEPPEGDIMRTAYPARNPGMSGVYLNCNRNKRGVVLNLREPAAKDALLKLLKTADVFVHSMRPAAIRKLGFDYETVKAEKPDIVYASAWGFRSSGPYADRPAYDDVIQGISGTTDLARRRGGESPDFAPMVMADKVAGLHAVSGITMALFHRERTGEGQQIEIPMFETVTSFNFAEHLSGAAFVPPLAPPGYVRVLDANRRPHRTKDGFMVVLPYNDKQAKGFFKAAGRPDLAEDERFATARARAQNVDQYYGLISELIATRTTAEWTELLKQADVPSIAVNTLEDVIEDEHFAATGFFVEYDHPSEGRVRTTGVPLHFEATPGSATRLVPPRLGEHTREVLGEAGFSQSQIDAMVASGAAIQAD
jgi:crotonobetainyl-CoA:carnitine CoA-transferase CaiB-like acyl-CoA transferase